MGLQEQETLSFPDTMKNLEAQENPSLLLLLTWDRQCFKASISHHQNGQKVINSDLWYRPIIPETWQPGV